MKGVLTGLKNLKQVAAGTSQGGGGFLKLKDGQSVSVRFLQELDEKGKLYDEDRGLAISVFEHSNPDDFTQRFLCTLNDEGKCVGCENVVKNRKWSKRSRLYINAYVVEDGQVQIVATGFSPKGIGGALIEYADDFGTVCDRNYKLKRTGEGLKTQYTIYPREVSDFDFSATEVRDLTGIAKYRSYDECLDMVSGADTNLAESGNW